VAKAQVAGVDRGAAARPVLKVDHLVGHGPARIVRPRRPAMVVHREQTTHRHRGPLPLPPRSRRPMAWW